MRQVAPHVERSYHVKTHICVQLKARCRSASLNGTFDVSIVGNFYLVEDVLILQISSKGAKKIFHLNGINSRQF